ERAVGAHRLHLLPAVPGAAGGNLLAAHVQEPAHGRRRVVPDLLLRGSPVRPGDDPRECHGTDPCTLAAGLPLRLRQPLAVPDRRPQAGTGSTSPSVRVAELRDGHAAAADTPDTPESRRMSRFSRYILRVFFVQFAMLLVSFTALLQIFDLLSNSIDV